MFKLGGIWSTKAGIEYTVKAFSHQERKKMKGTGWFDTLAEALTQTVAPVEVEEVKEVRVISTSAQLKEFIREQITELGGIFDKRSGVEKLEEQLEELKNGNSDED